MPIDFSLDTRAARQAFDAAAESYDAAAVLQREVADRLVTRLEYIRLDPGRILDLGAGTGYATEKLMQRYRRAEVWAADFSPGMLQKAGAKGRWLRRPRVVCADAVALPFADASFDLVVSNLMLQWCLPLPKYLSEIRRIAAPDGLLMFSSFGPDTLKELRQAWRTVDDSVHVHDFLDMHDVGDALLAAGFAGPVMDMETVTLTYEDVLSLMRDLKAIGAVNASLQREKGLTGRARYRRMCAAYEAFRGAEGRLPATYEVIYGHGWIPSLPVKSKTERFKGIRVKSQ